ncbi:unnamed protein product [Fusarium graminearum]|nr:unnamed protein product [Fusarium graminearum]
MDEVKIDQITESRIFNVVSMLPTSLQSGPIRFLRRSISYHTLRPAVTVSGSQAKPRPLSEADATAMSHPLQSDMEQILSTFLLMAAKLLSQKKTSLLRERLLLMG